MVRLWVAISLLIITSPFLKTTKAFSQSWASPVDPALEVTPDQEPDRKLTYSVQGGTGFGVFQDIQVPFAPTGDRRADGSSATSELQDHFGFLLFGAVGRSWTLGSTDIDLAIKALLVRATLGPVETQTSSYSRFELATGADLLSVGDYNPTTLGFLTSLRRSNYLNISTGHYLETAAVGLRLTIQSTDRWTIVSRGLYAPLARFGYSKGALFSGDYLTGSETKLFEVGLENTFELRSDLQLTFGGSHERSRINLQDLKGYETFGLQVATAPNQSAKEFNLHTTLLHIGFKKSF